MFISLHNNLYNIITRTPCEETHNSNVKSREANHVNINKEKFTTGMYN